MSEIVVAVKDDAGGCEPSHIALLAATFIDVVNEGRNQFDTAVFNKSAGGLGKG